MDKPLSILHLPVRTRSGKSLGQVVNVEIDPRTHGVTKYHVKPSRLVPDLVSSPLLIHPDQVVQITAEAMVVDDAVHRQAGAPEPSAATG